MAMGRGKADASNLPHVAGSIRPNLRRSDGLDVVLVAETDDPLEQVEGRGEVNDRYFAEPLRLIGPSPSVRPPHPHMLGLACLATWLKRQGFSVEAFDNIFTVPASREAFFSALARGPRAVGISTTFMRSPATVSKIARWVRERSPRALLVLGGLSAEHQSEVRRLGDVTVCGPGEKTLSDLLSRLKDGADWRKLPNLICREVRTPSERDFALEQRPAPDWDLLPVRSTQIFPVQASTGCRYRCVFCDSPELGSRNRPYGPGAVSAIRDAHERFGATLFRFVDSNFTSWPEETEALCRALADEKLPIEWACNARPDNLAERPSLAAAMRSAGCRWLNFGIESGSDEILRTVRKGFSRKDILEGVRVAREAGLRIAGSFIVGLPGETPKTVEQTLEAVDLCRPDAAIFFIFCMLESRASDISRHPGRYGVTGHLTRWAHATMDSEEARRQARRCYEQVALRIDGTLPGPLPFTLRSCGLSEEEALAHYRGFRDYHRAKLQGDAAGLQAALEALRFSQERLSRAYEAEGWRSAGAEVSR